MEDSAPSQKATSNMEYLQNNGIHPILLTDLFARFQSNWDGVDYDEKHNVIKKSGVWATLPETYRRSLLRNTTSLGTHYVWVTLRAYFKYA